MFVADVGDTFSVQENVGICNLKLVVYIWLFVVQFRSNCIFHILATGLANVDMECIRICIATFRFSDGKQNTQKIELEKLLREREWG